MLIAIAIAEEIQGLGGSESFELLNFLGLWKEVSQISVKQILLSQLVLNPLGHPG